jgi:hypothetical protein
MRSCKHIIRFCPSPPQAFASGFLTTVSGAGVAVALCSIGTALGAVKRLLLPSILSRGSISSINRLWLVLRHILHWSSGRARWRIMNAIRRHCNIWLLIGERRRKLALLRAHAASSVRRIGDWSVWIGSWRRNRIILSSPSCFFFLSFPLGFLLLLPSLPFLANLLEFCLFIHLSPVSSRPQRDCVQGGRSKT